MSDPTSARYIVEASTGNVYLYDVHAIRDAHRRKQIASSDQVFDTQTKQSARVSEFLITEEVENTRVIVSGSEVPLQKWIVVGFGLGIGFTLAGVVVTVVPFFVFSLAIQILKTL